MIREYNMKRLFLIICLLFSCFSISYAGDDTKLRSQLDISYGDGTMNVTMIWDAAPSNSNSFFSFIPIPHKEFTSSDIWKRQGNITSCGLITLGYDYLLPKERFAIGARLSYTKVFERSNSQNCFDLEYATLTATLYYKKSGLVRLSGALELGAGFVDWNPFIAFNLVPISVLIGTDRCSGYMALNIGYRSIATFGIKIGL